MSSSSSFFLFLPSTVLHATSAVPAHPSKCRLPGAPEVFPSNRSFQVQSRIRSAALDAGQYGIRAESDQISLCSKPASPTVTARPARSTSRPRRLVKRRNFLFSLLAHVARVGVLTSAAKSPWSQTGLGFGPAV